MIFIISVIISILLLVSSDIKNNNTGFIKNFNCQTISYLNYTIKILNTKTDGACSCRPWGWQNLNSHQNL